MHRKLIILIAVLIISLQTYAQELYCNVQVNTQQVEGTERKVFETLRAAIFEFMNNRKWTDYTFGVEERIECSILINITHRITSDEFEAELSVALKRPIFNSTYNSTTLNYIDRDFNFSYVEYQPLEFIENTHTSNLTSVLAFYAYIFIGLDFDTYKLNGGTPYYEKAQNIVTAAQGSGKVGWKSFDSDKNRYWLAENLLNPSYSNVRKFLYQYHRHGLDAMYDDSNTGRSKITESLGYLTEVKNNRPNLFILQLIMEAKRDEFINVYSEGSATEKARAVNMLNKLDPANASQYDEIMK